MKKKVCRWFSTASVPKGILDASLTAWSDSGAWSDFNFRLNPVKTSYMHNLRDNLHVKMIGTEVSAAVLSTGQFLFPDSVLTTLAPNVLYLRPNSVPLLIAINKCVSTAVIGQHGTQKSVQIDVLMAHLLNPHLKTLFTPTNMATDVIVLTVRS